MRLSKKLKSTPAKRFSVANNKNEYIIQLNDSPITKQHRIKNIWFSSESFESPVRMR